MACGQQKVKGGNGSNIASSSASSSASCSASCSASIITLNLGVGCAPSCWPIFGFRNLLGARRGAEGSFLCSLITDFLAEGAGWGASPGRGGELGCLAQQVLKKIVRLASVFPSPPFRSSDFAGPRRSRLYGFHTGTRSLSNRKGRGRRSGGREREPRRAGEGRCLESKLLRPDRRSPVGSKK